MKVAKLVLGILTIVFSCFVTLQSCAAGISNSLEKNDEVSGSAGLFVSILMLAGAIVMIATRKGSKGGSIASLIIFLLAALIGFPNAGSYSDLKIWSGFCVILAVINIIALFTAKKNQDFDKKISDSVQNAYPQQTTNNMGSSSQTNDDR